MNETSQALAIDSALASEHNPDLLLAGQFASIRLSNGHLDPLINGLLRASLRDRALRYLIETAPGRSAVIAPYLQNSAPGMRIDLVNALGLSADPQALPLVLGMQQDTDAAVARASTRAVARLQGDDPRLP